MCIIDAICDVILIKLVEIYGRNACSNCSSTLILENSATQANLKPTTELLCSGMAVTT